MLMKIYFFLILALPLFLLSCRKTVIVRGVQAFNTEAFHNRIMGASAREILDDSVYKSLTVEIQYMRGFKPAPGTVEYFSNFLHTYLNKPWGINIVLSEIIWNGKDTLSKDEVLAIENEKRTQFASEDQIAIYVLFTNGIHPGNKILGMAYRNTSAVVYGKAINNHSTKAGKLTRQELESAVLLHEIGHLLGLVNKGTDPQSLHIDAIHHDHCNNRKCLMYHSVETKKLSSILLKGNIPVFDKSCIDDLIANGGRNTPDFKPFIKPF